MHPLQPFLELAAPHGLGFDQPGGVFRVPLTGAYGYHSGMKVVGVVTGYCLLAAALAGLPPPRREEIAILSGHPGSGMEDTFEYFTRCVSGGRYQRHEFAAGLRIPEAEGVFRWRVQIGDARRDLSLREGVVPAVLFTAVPAGEEAARLAYQLEVASRMLVADPGTLFDSIAEGTA